MGESVLASSAQGSWGGPTLTTSCALQTPSLSPGCARAAVEGGEGGCDQCGEELPSEWDSSCF